MKAMRSMIAVALAAVLIVMGPGLNCYAAVAEVAAAGQARSRGRLGGIATPLESFQVPRFADSFGVASEGIEAAAVTPLAFDAKVISPAPPLEKSDSPLAQASLAARESRSPGYLRQALTSGFAGPDVFNGRVFAQDPIPGLPSSAVPSQSRKVADGPILELPTGRGPPKRVEPPPSGGNGTDGPGSSGRAKRWAVALAAIGAGASLVALAPHAAILQTTAALAKAGYILANALGFVYPLFQVGALFRERSGNISMAKQATGLGASLLLAFNMFYLNSSSRPTLFAAYQNLFGALSFSVIIGLALWYQRHPKPAGSAPVPRREVAWKTAAAVMLASILTAGMGLALTTAIPLLPAAALIVPFQLLVGLGFSYLTFPEYLKIEREKSVGAASPAMTGIFLAAMVGVAIWSIEQLATLPGVSTLAALGALAAFTLATTAAAAFVFRWLVTRKWKFKEAQINMIGFVVVAAFMTAVVAAGYAAFNSSLGIPPGQGRTFLTLLFYLVDNILAAVNAALTLRAFRSYGGARPRPSA